MRATESDRRATQLADDPEGAQAKHRGEAAELAAAVAAAEKQVAELQDKLDLCAETEQKFALLQDKSAKYRARIEELSDVEDQLVKQEKVFQRHVDKISSLEFVVETIPSLKSQLEDYKTRTTKDAQKIHELTREPSAKRSANDLQSQHQDLAVESQARQQHAAALQQELAVAAAAANSSSSGGGGSGGGGEAGEGGGMIGLGRTELSPEVTELVARLERENASLAQQVDRQQGQNIDRLENDVDDAQRLASSYAEQLDSTKALLDAAQDSVAALQRSPDAER